MVDLNDLIRDFAMAAEKAKIDGWSGQVRGSLRVEYRSAPHRPPPLPAGFGAAYAFALCPTADKSVLCRAGYRSAA
jgi:hypothetical protein